MNSYIFVVCSIWCKNLFIVVFVVVVVVYKFCCTKSRSFPFFKSCHQNPTAVEVRFILLQNVGINQAFRGYKKPHSSQDSLTLSVLPKGTRKIVHEKEKELMRSVG